MRASPAAGQPGTKDPTATTRIMLIEDNASDIELTRTAFAEAGITAEFVVYRDGDEAIRGIQGLGNDPARLPALVLLDLNLPRSSGHVVLSTIRAQTTLDRLPVLVFSTSNHPVDRTRCLQAGASDYLVKPPYFKDLLTLVERIRDEWLEPRP